VIAAAKTDAALGQILANGNFFLESPTPNASKYARLDAGAVTPRHHTLFYGTPRRKGFLKFRSRLSFNPDGRGIALLAETCYAFTDLEGL
jgi:hypothetical protein